MTDKLTYRAMWATLAISGMIVVSCSQTKTPEARKAEKTRRATKSSTVMGFLETRDHKITIKADGLYTIKTKGGKVLAEDVTLKELQATNPRLKSILERTLASRNEPPPPKSNNRIDPGLIRPHNDARSYPVKSRDEFGRSGLAIRHNDAGLPPFR